jgi:hypothetical protein
MLFYLRTETSKGEIYIPGTYSRPNPLGGGKLLKAVYNVPIFEDDLELFAVQAVAVIRHANGSFDRYDLENTERFDEPLVIEGGSIQYFTRTQLALAAMRDLEPSFDTTDVLCPCVRNM